MGRDQGLAPSRQWFLGHCRVAVLPEGNWESKHFLPFPHPRRPLVTIAVMRFRIWHLLLAMAFVAVWAPLSQWLLRLEAADHPSKPQTAIDVAAFWLGSTTITCVPFVIGWIVVRAIRKKRENDAAA